jgi:hypothetical protein
LRLNPDKEKPISNSHNNNTPMGLIIAIIRSLSRFPLGDVAITNGVPDAVDADEAMLCLARHALGDWGDVPEDDWLENQHALENGLRLMSVYKTSSGVKFWIITEWDRSVTTILMPDEY